MHHTIFHFLVFAVVIFAFIKIWKWHREYDRFISESQEIARELRRHDRMCS